MRWLCWFGWHRWSVYPQTTPLWGLRLGYVWAFCDRCGRGEVIHP